MVNHIVHVGHLFVRIAGISGALAVGLGAYGAHGLKNRTDKEREVFMTANRYHMLHTLALLAVPLTNQPNMVGVTMLLGMLGFCGTCYYSALSGDTSLNRFTPYGGVTLMIAWAMMAL
ncbi:transmembrane protein 256 homolog [Amphiura filiformis]|uniref:transmembrane protein 256 homolog n=1 Tax=Amphiura filiformis TaxID=82378 RepID=UPI003B20C95D